MSRSTPKSVKSKGLKAWLRSFLIGPISSYKGYLAPNAINFGVTVNTDAALRFTAVFAAIKILSENIASLPKSVKKFVDGGAVDAKRHAAWKLLAVRPNGYTDKFTFWFSLVANALSKGNGYAAIEFENGRPVALHLIDPESVQIVLDKGEKMYVVNDSDQEKAWLNRTYFDYEMVHIMFFTVDGVHGLDPITYNAISIGRGIATQKFASEFYEKGGQIKGTLETEGSLGDEEYDNFMKHYNAAAQNYETPLLEYGIKYKNIGISPVAAQLIQSETMSIQDISRIYGVPCHLLAELSHATFSNIEQQNIQFATYSLRPLCKRIEEQLELKLFIESEQGKYDVKFDLRGMMRGDDTARANYYQSGINAGWMTPNEAREQEDMRALPGLDAPRMPLNTAYINEAGTIINPNNSARENDQVLQN